MNAKSGPRRLYASLLIIGLFVILLVLPASSAKSETIDLSTIAENLVSAYNNQDAVAYRENFGEKLKKKHSLENMKEILSGNMSSHGVIVSHEIRLSPDGKRALVFLDMEQSTFDVHLRINAENQIARLTWLPHKADPSENDLSGHEQHLVLERYQTYVDQFVQAIRDTSAETMLSLMVKDENDDWTLEDYQSFLIRMNSRGLQRVGEIEVLAPNELLVPIYFELVDMGFYLGFDKENKISGLRISNYAPSDTKGLSYAILGADTLLTSDLRSFDQLRETFVADSGKVRFVTLLSPT